MQGKCDIMSVFLSVSQANVLGSSHNGRHAQTMMMRCRENLLTVGIHIHLVGQVASASALGGIRDPTRRAWDESDHQVIHDYPLLLVLRSLINLSDLQCDLELGARC